MYKTVYVKTKKESRRTTSDRLRSVKVSGEETAEALETCIQQHAKEGYKVFSITPMSSASSSNVGTGGWGFSYTDGMIVVFEKVS
ncbi:hypothetical protein [Flammeovirga kamogawensis]|uniref:DUF4177 domain-containing protein n=1 Tax=Flammeovirga kamogawensis TaxID=373891 RepID=A0ABX8GUY6_9BACT|nr:hypothetical protein [Flammeovirga kamogawensis]MBB6462508.1 fatty acid-binding protein DegV [Flammeovirga kamogawensis]QWG06755.1 DUF4177 domain-containing protein [Flammeovirga kamogawensis]TRX68578.1 hypothetical protein EO216_10800 [Flammeovirga kamogawensis]